MSTDVIPVISRPSRKPASFSAFDMHQFEIWADKESLPRYRARQFFDAVHRRSVQSAAEITEFPASLRDRLTEEFPLRAVRPRLHLRSTRDDAEKVVFDLFDGATVETVLIPSGHGLHARYTVCVSSQVGCPAACSFCATGLGGFTRNLTRAEITDQVSYFAHSLGKRTDRVSNVVFMGMGEPLLNVKAVSTAIQQLTDPHGIGLGARHITVSTVGIVPQVRKFAEWAGQVNLAVSLHAPNNTLRSTIVPYNERFPVQDLMSAVRDYLRVSGRRVSFEYVLLQGLNDDPKLARELARLIRPLGTLAHVNLIPWNPFEEGKFIRSDGPDAQAFVRELTRVGVNATIRHSKGLDISAACGQLRDEAARQSTIMGSPSTSPV